MAPYAIGKKQNATVKKKPTAKVASDLYTFDFGSDSDSDSDADVPLLTRKPKLCAPGALTVGEYVSRISYAKIVDIQDKSFELENTLGKRFKVSAAKLEETAYAALQADSSRTVTPDQLLDALRNVVRDKVFSVSYTVPYDAKELLEGEDLRTPAGRKRAADFLDRGSCRVIEAAHAENINNTGRMRVWDLNAKKSVTIDLNKITQLCSAGVRYKMKKSSVA